MRRTAIHLADIAARDNLRLALWKAARGHRQRADVAAFLAAPEAHLDTLAAAILDGSAPYGDARTFVIRDPKRRTITAACFADRVLHHAILNLAEARFEQALVASSFACRPGLGVHAAVRAVQWQLQRAPWYVQVDVAAYFASIDHGVLLSLLARRFKGADFLALLARIVDRATPGGVGLPIGMLTSQHFANAYLDAADRALLARSDVRGHVRYMDDIVWWCDSRAGARASLIALRHVVEGPLRLRLKAGVRLARSVSGIAFCGFRVRRGSV